MRKILIILLGFFIVSKGHSQSDSLRYINLLTGSTSKKWYLDSQTYLGNTDQPCKGNALIIYYRNQMLIEEPCDKKKLKTFFWKIYRDEKYQWHFSYGKNDYEISVYNYDKFQKVILSKRNYVSKRTLVYVYIKD